MAPAEAGVVEQRRWARYGYRLLFAICRILPYRCGILLGWLVGWLAWWCDAAGRRQVCRNLAPLLPAGCPQALTRTVRRNYIAFVTTVIDHARMPWIPTRWLTTPNLRVIDPWHLRDHPATEAALIIATHCNWELLARVFLLHGWVDQLGAIALSHDDPDIDASFDRIRALVGFTPLYLDRAPLASLRWLKEGGQVAIIADRVYTSHGLAIPIGRSRLELPVGPAALSTQSGAPVIPVHLARSRATGFSLVIGPRLHPPNNLPRNEQVRWLTTEAGRWFDRFLRATPTQWAAFEPVWLHDPQLARPDSDSSGDRKSIPERP